MITLKEYEQEREKKALQVRAEFLETVNTKIMEPERVRRTMRAIDYLVTQMGFNTVVTEQLPGWVLVHMVEFGREEVSLATRKRSKKAKRVVERDK